MQSSVGCPAVLWRGARDGRDGQTAGGAEVTALGLIMRCGEWILGSGSWDSRWYQCAPPEPRAFPGPKRDRFGDLVQPGRFCHGRPLDSGSNPTTSPWKLSSFRTGNLEGNWRGAASFVVHFLAFFQRPGRTPFPTLCLHACHLSALSTPPKLHSAALAIVSLEMCWPA